MSDTNKPLNNSTRNVHYTDMINYKKQCEQNGIEYIDAGYKIHFPKRIIKNIICGMNISDENMNKLKKICKDINLSCIKQVVPCDAPFDLYLKEIKL